MADDHLQNVIDSIPDEIWLYIFDYLTFNTLFDVSATCSNWRRLSSDRAYWGNVSLGKLSRNLQGEDFHRLVQTRGEAIHTISFVDRMASVRDSWIHPLPDNAPNLTSVSIRNCVRLTDAGVDSIARCLSITALDLSSCPHITDTGLENLAATGIALSSLHLRGCNRLTDAGIVSLASSDALQQSLVDLNLGLCAKLGIDSIVAMRDNLEALRTLNLFSLKFRTRDAIDALPVCLTDLNISMAIMSTASIESLAHLTNLRSLDIYGNISCDDQLNLFPSIVPSFNLVRYINVTPLRRLDNWMNILRAAFLELPAILVFVAAIDDRVIEEWGNVRRDVVLVSGKVLGRSTQQEALWHAVWGGEETTAALVDLKAAALIPDLDEAREALSAALDLPVPSLAGGGESAGGASAGDGD